MRPRRRFARGAFALGIGLVTAATVSLYVMQPPPGSTAAAEEIDAQPSPAPAAPAPLVDVSEPAIPAPTPSVTYPPDQIDKSWPKNPPWDACPAPVWPGTPSEGSPGEGRRVLILGDSLTRESQEAMTGYLQEDGWTPTFRCWGSKRLDWGLDQIKRAKELKQLPEHVIVALGTNDISWVDPATTERRVNTLLDRLGPERQVLWVDLDIAYSPFSIARADWFNGMIREVAKDRPNLKVIPWERTARQEKAARFDGIHYGSSGYRLRARTLTDELSKRARKVDASDAPSPSPTASPTPSPTPAS